MFSHFHAPVSDVVVLPVVVNGERNSMTVTIENKSDRNVTLGKIAGSLRHPETDHLVKNVGRGCSSVAVNGT